MLFFRKILQLDKFKDADFIYDKSFKILAQKHKSKAFLLTNLGIFVFPRNFAIRQIRGCRFQIWEHCFQNPAQKYPI